MSPSDFTRATDAVQKGLQPLMSEHGFRRHGRTFSRLTADGLTHVVNLQMGSFDPPGTTYIPGLRAKLYGSLTVNLGVSIPEVARVDQETPPKSVREYHCCIRARLGELGPDGRDVWWELSSGSALTAEISRRLVGDALPWLDRFATRDAVLAVFEAAPPRRWDATPGRIICALIRQRRGEIEKARALLSDQVRASLTYPQHAQYVRELALKLGLGALAA